MQSKALAEKEVQRLARQVKSSTAKQLPFDKDTAQVDALRAEIDQLKQQIETDRLRQQAAAPPEENAQAANELADLKSKMTKAKKQFQALKQQLADSQRENAAAADVAEKLRGELESVRDGVAAQPVDASSPETVELAAMKAQVQQLTSQLAEAQTAKEAAERLLSATSSLQPATEVQQPDDDIVAELAGKVQELERHAASFEVHIATLTNSNASKVPIGSAMMHIKLLHVFHAWCWVVCLVT
jgi:predicted  nucleic acid-binding Zn-ribbon protein